MVAEVVQRAAPQVTRRQVASWVNLGYRSASYVGRSVMKRQRRILPAWCASAPSGCRKYHQHNWSEFTILRRGEARSSTEATRQACGSQL